MIKKTKNIRFKIFTVNCGTYPFEILCYFGSDKKHLYKCLADFVNKSSVEEYKKINLKVGNTSMLNTGQTVLYLNRIPNSVGDLAVISHEIFHATCFVMERVGITYSDYSDEAFAYLIEYITKQIFSNLNIKF